jgi:hypothetical protein
LKYSADGRLGAQLEISLCAQKLYIASQWRTFLGVFRLTGARIFTVYSL